MTANEECCGNCFYARSVGHDWTCHRFPPEMAIVAFGSRWIPISLNEWCGEWKAEEKV